MSHLTLEQFKRGYLAFLSAFNRGDFATAFSVLAPDCEFSTIEELLEARVMVGREQVRSFFEEVRRDVLPDWRVETVRVLQASEDVFVTLDRGRGTGRGSGAPVEQALSSVFQLREGDGLVIRGRQYPSWEQGLRAAGLNPAEAADARRAERSGDSLRRAHTGA